MARRQAAPKAVAEKPNPVARQRPAVERTPAAAEVIRRDEFYSLSEIKRRFGVQEKTLRNAFRKGLKSAYFGKKKVVRGSDLDDFLFGSSDSDE